MKLIFFACVFGLLMVSFSMRAESKEYFGRLNHRIHMPKSMKEVLELRKKLLQQKQQKLKQENENNIYRQFLASRIKSSIIRDFLIMRY
jgi:hypothetical protein